MLDIHIAVLLFGLAGLFGKFLSLSPLLIVAGRTLFAAVALVIVLLYLKQRLIVNSKKDLAMLTLSGAILTLHWLTFFHSIQLSSVAVGLIAFSSFPLFVTFMEPYFFRERLRYFDIVMAIIVFIGLLLLVPSFELGNHITQGACWGVLSGLTFAMLSLLNRNYVRRYSPLLIACYQNTLASAVLLPFLIAVEWTLEIKDILLLSILGVVCTAVAHTLFIKGLIQVKAQLAGIIAILEPVYGIIFALLLLGELPAPRTALGGGIILGVTVIAVNKRQTTLQ